MRSVNFALNKIYFSLLSGIEYNGEVIQVYDRQAPDDITSTNYIVFLLTDNNDNDGQYKASTSTTMQVTIHTHSLKYNPSQVADAIADDIFERIYPNKQDTPDMSADGFQLVHTRLTGDRTTPYNIQNTRNYLDRILTFTHQIFHVNN